MVAAENRKRLPAKTSGTTATVALLETRLKWRVWSVWSVWSVRVNSSRLVPIWCKDHERAKLTIAHVVAWLLNQVDRTSSHLFFLEVPIDHICYTASALPGLLAFVSTDFNFFQSWLLPFWERRKGRQRGSCW